MPGDSRKKRHHTKGNGKGKGKGKEEGRHLRNPRLVMGEHVDLAKVPTDGGMEDDVLRMATNSLAKNDWDYVFENHYIARGKREDTDVRVVSEDTQIRNQENSGRCWIFTTLAFYRSILINKSKPALTPDSVMLSPAYLYFWHLFESSAAFMEKIHRYAGEPINSQVNAILMGNPVTDGASEITGHILVERYGIVPELKMPDTAQSKDTEKMRRYLIKILRIAAYHIRKTHTTSGGDTKAYYSVRNRFLRIIRRLLVASLGEPPRKFTYSFEQCDEGKYLLVEDITPKEFYTKYLKPHDKRVVSIITNCSQKLFPDGQWQFFKDTNSTVNTPKKDQICLSVDVDKLAEGIRDSLRHKIPVFTGTDVVNDFSEELGWADVGLFDPTIILEDADVKFLDKVPEDEYISYSIYTPNHAMLVIGYGTEDHKPDGKITHWLLENSWGDESGDGGLVRVSHDWFLRNLYVVALQDQFLPKGYVAHPKEEDVKEFEIYDAIPALLN